MQEYEVARQDEAVELVAMRDEIAEWLTRRGVPQWTPGEFPVDRMRSWIGQGAVYVRRHANDIICSVAVLWDDPHVWPADDVDAGYIHSLMVRPGHGGRGLGLETLRYAESVILRSGRRIARLDAVEANDWLLSWYRDRGYVHAGITQFASPRVHDCVRMQRSLDEAPPDHG